MSTLHDPLPIEPLDRPVGARVRPPGSKSLTNRALVAAALASGGVSRLDGALEADDTATMRRGLRAFGVTVEDVDDPWLVLGTGGRPETPSVAIDARASGTTARFLTAFAALAAGPTVVDGSTRMRARPIGHLAEALVRGGVAVETANGFPPVRVGGGGLRGGSIEVDGSLSSQFASALLLVSPCAEAAVDLQVVGTPVSTTYLVSTVEVMRAFGATVEADDLTFRVEPTGYRQTHFEVEADASAAVYPLAAAAVLGGVVVVDGIAAGSSQPDLRFVDVLEQMGCVVLRGEHGLVLAGPSRSLQPVEVDMGGAPDAAMALAVVCLFADGPSRIRGLSTLRIKETDRLVALRTEVERIGGRAEIDGDTLVVGPGSFHGTRVETYDDHRMAMSFAIAGLRVPGITIADPGCVSKTWPGYFDMLAGL
ncbi:MAG: 3-phosphoshikimate 1-carboxyvinyltransferase [Acidimicrobiia bacterium]|jgi:3-phosphoshikimate 1-carboxyvinyltransferase